MPTGLLIRDFEKQYRELRYSNSGSIEFTEIEHNAYRLSLTLEITHIDAPRYGSLKTLPTSSHYGYVTLFRGSTVTDTIAIKYPKFRVFDIRNQGIWNYHQLTENQQLGASTIQLSVNAASRSLWEVLGDGIGNLTEFVIGAYYRSIGGETPGWVLQAFDEGTEIEEPFGNEFDKYRAFPIATPFPDIAKFKSDIPVSFLWRLEAWYLVNPLVYVVDNPTDTGDETEGEDEYPQPESGDGDGDGDEFPPSDAIPSDRDPRDFDDSNIPPPPPPFLGGQCEGKAYRVDVLREASISPPTGVQTYRNVIGPIRGIRQSSEVLGNTVLISYFLRHGENQEIALGGLFATLNGEPNNPSMSIQNISTEDGSPDNCGNPPPIL